VRARHTALCVVCLLVLTGGCHRDATSGGASSAIDTADAASQSEQTQKDGSVPTDTVKIAPQDQARSGIRFAPVDLRTIPTELSAVGQVTMDERATQHIGALADGRIVNVYVLPGDTVKRGQVLAKLHSHLVHESVAALTQAFAAVNRQQSAVSFATQARDRYERLFQIQAASLEERQRSEQDLAQAQKDLIDAQANVHAEREHLAEVLQISPSELRPDTLERWEKVPVRAVESGVVITRNITPGQVVSTGAELFTVTNLSTVWVNASVNEGDIPTVKIGAATKITIGQDERAPMNGNVSMLGDVVDPQTRTLPIRISVPNPQMRLRPGMFVQTTIAQRQAKSSVFVPPDALQDINGFSVVFVTSDGQSFQARAVTTGMQRSGMVEVLKGLTSGDKVVTAGAFMVKSELLKGTVGEG
jgi:cobalt-zinc-cadmium efflux system membrane fusion protein